MDDQFFDIEKPKSSVFQQKRPMAQYAEKMRQKYQVSS